MTLVIKKIDKRKLREFKAEAIRRGLTLSQAIEEAIELWLSSRFLLSDMEANNLAYVRFKRDLEKYEGKYVVFALGRFIGAFEKLDDIAKALKDLKPKPKHAIVLKVGYDRKVEGGLEWWGGSIKLEPV